jgi:hypothetical protein
MNTEEIIKQCGNQKLFTIIDMATCWQQSRDSMFKEFGFDSIINEVEERTPINTFTDFINAEHASKLIK